MFRYLFFGTCLFLVPGIAAAQRLPAGYGQEAVQQKCVGCHSLKVVTSKRATREEWMQIVDQMVARGAELEEEQIRAAVNYLAVNFGPHSHTDTDEPQTPINVNTATAEELAKAFHLTPAEAAAIVAFRRKHGKFDDVHQVEDTPDIDARKIEDNKDRIVF